MMPDPNPTLVSIRTTEGPTSCTSLTNSDCSLKDEDGALGVALLEPVSQAASTRVETAIAAHPRPGIDAAFLVAISSSSVDSGYIAIPGRPAEVTMTIPPYAISATPATRGMARPNCSDFSAKMSTVRPTMAAMFIKPSGKRIANSNQQQPRQYIPWLRPMAKAPA